MMGRLAMVWGLLGVAALLLQALTRLTPMAVEALSGELTVVQWIVVGVWVPVMAHAEGYRGFHTRFSPRVVARAQVLREDPRPLWVVFAPLFCMSLFHASRRGLLVARILVAAITLLVIGVRQLDQPWRGIIDAGVVVGLAIGLLSIGYHLVRALGGHAPPVPPDLPPPSEADA
ncbi:MAG: hypothetical protein K0V04_34510 [Deltaproteobacteria bacterium]|nr:hypothetical protein [Deltaproteobacteria bacterium]